MSCTDTAVGDRVRGASSRKQWIRRTGRWRGTLIVGIVLSVCPCRGQEVDTDLLIVGGTESGCAAAVQAARMGVERIVLVNDIEWLGGQFSAEGLGAIDENRAHGYDGSVPIPRSGLFREVIDAIEDENAALYGGIRRPGNTRVITTARPVVAEQDFRDLLKPFEEDGTLVVYSNYHVQKVLQKDDHVMGVEFRSGRDRDSLHVHAKVTIDASDWGDVIKGAADWDVGVDAKSEFQEPSAPESADPATDVNPITWCLIVERRTERSLLPMVPGYDARYFNGLWGWIDEKFAYTSRRLVDGQGSPEINHPDILLINSPPIDYPLDVYPRPVATALEQLEEGASALTLVAMTPEQREVVFRDARQHSLKYFYHLQQRFPLFQFLALSDEFGTEDQLPPKPYIRESLRLVAQHIIREQEVLGFHGRSSYASTMFPDAVFSWQFEMDFHPTQRSWTTGLGADGPWEASFRGNRRFGRGGTGRCVFPLRALVPKHATGLLGARKNLGYTSIVGSSCRLHDQSMHAGQASGAVAAVSLRHDENPADFYLRPERLAEVRDGLLDPPQGAGLAIWPFSDVDPLEQGFAAIQHLAVRRLLGVTATETSFGGDKTATPDWRKRVIFATESAGYDCSAVTARMASQGDMTRRSFAVGLWKHLSALAIPDNWRKQPHDADGDGIMDSGDPLPFTPGIVSWTVEADRDGRPDVTVTQNTQRFGCNFSAANGPAVPGFVQDSGAPFADDSGFGWKRDLTANTRLRHADTQPLRDGFVFTRTLDVWERTVANGLWRVTVCVGDTAHVQPGQNVDVEGTVLAGDMETSAGQFRELSTEVRVLDGRLSVTLGTAAGGSNTCINWLVMEPVKEQSPPSVP